MDQNEDPKARLIGAILEMKKVADIVREDGLDAPHIGRQVAVMVAQLDAICAELQAVSP